MTKLRKVIKEENEMGKVGRPLHHVTDTNKDLVRELKSFGLNHGEISKILKISEDTLERHYRHELDIALAEANSKVARSLFQKAVYDNDTTCQIFWLKTRARWRDKDDSESTQATEKLLEEVKALREDLVGKAKREY